LFIEKSGWKINLSIPSTDKTIIACKSLLEGKELSEDEEGFFCWFVTTVLPIIHLASCAKFNWHPLLLNLVYHHHTHLL